MPARTDAERGSERRDDEFFAGDAGKIDEGNRTALFVLDELCSGNGDRRLSDAARTDDRRQSVGGDGFSQFGNLGISPDDDAQFWKLGTCQPGQSRIAGEFLLIE